MILYRVEHGCYELKFQIPVHIKDKIFPLSTDQQTELGNLGVVWIQCDEYEYHTELNKVLLMIQFCHVQFYNITCRIYNIMMIKVMTQNQV